MENIILEEKYILEYIRSILNDYKIKSVEVDDARYHHNTMYCDASSILKMGLLSMLELKKQNIKDYDESLLSLMKDTSSHINDIIYRSLAVMNLKDLHRDEEEYDAYNPLKVDFRVSDSVNARRVGEASHYGNEFLVKDIITPDKFRAVDIRLLNLMKLQQYSVKDIIEKYNYLREIALAILENNLDIPLREMSNDNLTLDIDALAKTPKIIIK